MKRMCNDPQRAAYRAADNRCWFILNSVRHIADDLTIGHPRQVSQTWLIDRLSDEVDRAISVNELHTTGVHARRVVPTRSSPDAQWTNVVLPHI
jgi:hypothetical protein